MTRFVFDGVPIEYSQGDSIAVALARVGEHPAHGGCLCLSGDCGNCVATVNGVSWVRTCQTLAGPGDVVQRHPAVGNPTTTTTPSGTATRVRHEHADAVVIGGGKSGTAAAAEARATGSHVIILDTRTGDEVVAVYAGPTVISRSENGRTMRQIHADEVIVATGAAELHPVCPGNRFRGIVTADAATQLGDAGVSLGRIARYDSADSGAGELVRFEESSTRAGWVGAMVVRDASCVERVISCDTAIVSLGAAPRDVLARLSVGGVDVRVVGSAADAHALPSAPTAGMVCGCSKVDVSDLESVWAKGFTELELMKRSSLCGTGTCQGAACLPHLRAFIDAKTGSAPEPFTARPAARQLTIGEAGTDFHSDAWRKTPLHHEHIRLGAQMDRWGGWWRPWNYGDHVAEYWAVREGVSIGDVSTLGKMVIAGPDTVELLERLYPTTVADIKPGRSRYVLILNERGHLFDDGMICRETDTRFVLSFTSGGAAGAEMWVRDWIETWGLKVHVLDQTMSLGAINVTGPLAGELLQRLGVAEPPKFLQHRRENVAGVPCHIMRLSFTGEASFELHHPVDRSVELWRSLMHAGADLGIRPHGLQALFGLRLEKGHVIVGVDTELDTTPRRIDHDWAVKMGKPFFLGQDALRRTADAPDHRRLVGLTMASPAPVEGSPLFVNGELAGHVCSSFDSPLLGHAVMLAWVKKRWAVDAPSLQGGEVIDTNDELTIDGRVAEVAATPFYDPEGARARL